MRWFVRVVRGNKDAWCREQQQRETLNVRRENVKRKMGVYRWMRGDDSSFD